MPSLSHFHFPLQSQGYQIVCRKPLTYDVLTVRLFKIIRSSLRLRAQAQQFPALRVDGTSEVKEAWSLVPICILVTSACIQLRLAVWRCEGQRKEGSGWIFVPSSVGSTTLLWCAVLRRVVQQKRYREFVCQSDLLCFSFHVRLTSCTTRATHRSPSWPNNPPSLCNTPNQKHRAACK